MPSSITEKYTALIAAAEALAGTFNDPTPNYPGGVTTPQGDWNDTEQDIGDTEKTNKAIQILELLKRPKRVVGYV